jgi:CRP-like cAMP-binding protein
MPLHAQQLWHIECGVVRTLTWNADGELAALGLWGPTDIVGRPMSDIEPYQIDCLTDVKAILLPPEAWPQAIATIIRQHRQAERLLSIARTKHQQHRLVELLVWLADKFGQPEVRGTGIALRLTHQQIAELIGSTRVTVTRQLQQLEKAKIIYRPCKQYIILSPTA